MYTQLSIDYCWFFKSLIEGLLKKKRSTEKNTDGQWERHFFFLSSVITVIEGGATYVDVDRWEEEEEERRRW